MNKIAIYICLFILSLCIIDNLIFKLIPSVMIGTKHRGESMKVIKVVGACMSIPLLGASHIQLQKAFLHTHDTQHAVVKQKPLSLEMNKLVFYFSGEPILTRLPDYGTAPKNGMITVRFLFAAADISSSEAKQMITAINKYKNPHINYHISLVSKPVAGVQLSITYDPTMVAFDYDGFESIGGQKGMLFTFYDKSLLERLKSKSNTLLQTACAPQPTIVIDCGHGGQDTGALGFFGSIEKDLTRSIGLQLAQYAHERGAHVVLTRADDEFVALDERTSKANGTDAQLLVSIHANHASNQKASGIETFYFGHSLLKPINGQRVADEKLIHEMSDNLEKLSNHLAQSVHNHLIKNARVHAPVVDRKVKQAASQLLMGSTLPAILIEVGFISNEQEAALLLDHNYQQALVAGIYDGIVAYLKNSSC